MTPVVCRIKHDPENAVYADCVRACIASVMDMDAGDVPHFYHDNCDGLTGFGRINEFLAPFGLAAFSVAYDGAYSMDDVLALMGEQNAATVYLLFGQTAYGDHVVVCRGGECIHDPAWFRSPLFKAAQAGYWIVMVLAKC